MAKLIRIQMLWVNRFNNDEVNKIRDCMILNITQVFTAARIQTDAKETITIRGYRTRDQLNVSFTHDKSIHTNYLFQMLYRMLGNPAMPFDLPYYRNPSGTYKFS